MEEQSLHELYLKKSEYIDSPEIDLRWLEEKLDRKDFLQVEESITTCIIKNDEQLFTKGFYCAVALITEGKK